MSFRKARNDNIGWLDICCLSHMTCVSSLVKIRQQNDLVQVKISLVMLRLSRNLHYLCDVSSKHYVTFCKLRHLTLFSHFAFTKMNVKINVRFQMGREHRLVRPGCTVTLTFDHQSKKKGTEGRTTCRWCRGRKKRKRLNEITVLSSGFGSMRGRFMSAGGS